MKPYSVDLRERVVGAVVDKGWTWEQAAEAFDVSVSSVSRFLAAHRAGRSLVPHVSSGRPPLLRLPEHVAALREHLEAQPDAEFSERCEHLAQSEGIFVSVPTLWRATRALGWTRKKRRSPRPSRTGSSGPYGAG